MSPFISLLVVTIGFALYFLAPLSAVDYIFQHDHTQSII